MDWTSSGIWSSPTDSVGSLRDCPLGPLELAGSGESPLEKRGECKVHQERCLLGDLCTAKQNVVNLQAKVNEELPAGLLGFEGAKPVRCSFSPSCTPPDFDALGSQRGKRKYLQRCHGIEGGFG